MRKGTRGLSARGLSARPITCFLLGEHGKGVPNQSLRKLFRNTLKPAQLSLPPSRRNPITVSEARFFYLREARDSERSWYEGRRGGGGGKEGTQPMLTNLKKTPSAKEGSDQGFDRDFV